MPGRTSKEKAKPKAKSKATATAKDKAKTKTKAKSKAKSKVAAGPFRKQNDIRKPKKGKPDNGNGKPTYT